MSRALVFIGFLTLVVSFAGCGGQAIPINGATQPQPTPAGANGIHPLCNGCNPYNGGGGDGGGANPSPTPTAYPFGPVVAVAEPGTSCDASEYQCDGAGPDFLSCYQNCRYYVLDYHGNLLAIAPTPGAQCDGSSLELGQTYPRNGTEITDIAVIFEPNGAGGYSIAGWLYYQNGQGYRTAGVNGATYIELKSGAYVLWGGWLKAFPQGSDVYTAITDQLAGIYPMQQANPGAFIKVITAAGGWAESCFTSTL